MNIKSFVLFIFILNVTELYGNLFCKYPSLASHISYVSLGRWPTDVKKLEVLSEQLGAQIYLKDEGDCGSVDENGYHSFGGNKVRKLEFLLADAMAKGYSAVLTYGGYASNHMVATACYAKKLGLQAIGLLSEQYPPANISRNLLLNLHFGAHIFKCPLPRLLEEDEIVSFLNDKGLPPAYVIPIGGSNILGVLGIVNAVFELQDQIAQGLIPEPDVIYVPFGSMGTTAGLVLGIKMAGLKTKVHAVKVTKTEKFNALNLCELISKTNNYLHQLDESVPLFDWNHDTITIRADFLGDGYAYPTMSSQMAMEMFRQNEFVILDQTYTAKAADALVCDCKNNVYHADTVILFWNSYCSYEYPELAQKIDRNLIPEWMHEFI